MPAPSPSQDRAAADINLQRGVQCGRRIRPVGAAYFVDGAQHPVDLAECHRRRRQHGGPIRGADGVAQLAATAGHAAS